jgi:TonB family protein
MAFMSVSPALLLGASFVAFALVGYAPAQNPGDPVPREHASRAFLAQPVYTSSSMVFGTWSTIAADGSRQALTGAPLAYEVVVTDAEITISSADDPYGLRTFGIVGSRRVESWVEYELRGQGGTYYLTAQIGRRSDGTPAAVFVLSPPGALARIERFVVPEPDGTIAVNSPPQAHLGSITSPAQAPGSRARRVDDNQVADAGIRRVTPSDLMQNSDRRVTPTYPNSARAAGIEGTVIIEIVVDEKGKVAEATVVSGPAVLRAEALRAASQWRFRPFTLDDLPSRVRGQLSFRFSR